MFAGFIFAAVITGIVAYFCYRSMKPVANATNANNYIDAELNLSVCTDQFIRTEKKKKNND